MEYTMSGKKFVSISEELSKYDYGAVTCYGAESWDCVKEIQELPCGFYEFVGTSNQFKISPRWGSEIEKEILVSTRDYGNPIHVIVNAEVDAKGEPDFEEQDEDDYSCSRCRGGGCPSCDTSGFFTGIKIYD